MSLKFWKEQNRPANILQAARENYWFDSGGLQKQVINPALNGQVTADIAIVGGGFTGLAAAYQLIANNPDKKIVLVEAACCGYGASGRNGGFADTGVRNLWEICDEQGPEKAREVYDITLEGLDTIRNFVEEHGVDCDFSPRGSIELANDSFQMQALEEDKKFHDRLGLEARLIDTDELRKTIRSERYVGGLWYPYGATVNPFKLSRGMKRVVEQMGVEIFERSPALRVEFGRRPAITTERGQVRAQALVIATDGYSPALGLFKRRVIPMCAYLVATEPLTPGQRESIGWAGREKLSDIKPVFDYFHLSVDDRIVFGGAGLRYLFGGRICRKTHMPSIRAIEKSLFETFPQLEGLRITHHWGGTLGMSFNFLPSVGVLGDDGNVFYAVAYSGEGTVLTQVAGKIINHLYREEENRLTKLSFVNKPIPCVWPEPVRYLGILAFKFYYTRFGRRAPR